MLLAAQLRRLVIESQRNLLIPSQIALTTDTFACLFHNTVPTCGTWKDWNLKNPGADKPDKLKKYRRIKTGGRGPDGRIWNHREGGGASQSVRHCDHFRQRLVKDGPLIEKVQAIVYDPIRSANLAIVAGGINKRYIIAGMNMKPGDLIKTSTEIPDIPVQAVDGDAHPIGALAIGTIVNCVEIYPNEGAKIARAAGVSAQLVRKLGDKCTLRMPSGREILVHQSCMATVGRIGNEDYNTIPMGSPNRKRWLGIRPRSGLWHKKTGRHGRKINPPKPMVDYTKNKKENIPRVAFTV